MFDDLETNGQDNNSQIPTAKIDLNGNLGGKDHLFDKNVNVGKEKIDDIFSDTDLSSKPAPLQPKSQADFEADASLSENQSNNFKKAAVLAGFIFVLAVIIIGGYIVISKILIKGPVIKTSMEEENKERMETEEINNNIKTEEKIEEKNEEILRNDEAKDTDQDGLSDAEEKKFGLSIDKADSDEDGLFDREEVKIYRTDPLNKDTDGDSYSDGDEVKSGYDPNGSGKLFDLPN